MKYYVKNKQTQETLEGPLCSYQEAVELANHFAQYEAITTDVSFYNPFTKGLNTTGILFTAWAWSDIEREESLIR